MDREKRRENKPRTRSDIKTATHPATNARLSGLEDLLLSVVRLVQATVIKCVKTSRVIIMRVNPCCRPRWRWAPQPSMLLKVN